MTTQTLDESAPSPSHSTISARIAAESVEASNNGVSHDDQPIENVLDVQTFNEADAMLPKPEQVVENADRSQKEEQLRHVRREGRPHQPRHPPCPILFLPNMSSNAFEKDLAEFALLLPAPVIRTFMYMSDAAHHGFVESATVEEGTRNLEFINAREMEVKGKKIVAEYSRRRTVEDRRTYEQRQHRRKATDDVVPPRERRRSRSPPSRAYPARRDYERYAPREDRYAPQYERYPPHDAPRGDRYPSRGDRYPPRDERYPSRDYAPPSRDYAPRDYAPPSRDYAPPSRDYAPSSRDYAPPSRDYAPPSRDYAPPSRDYAPPSREYVPPSREYAPPAYAQEAAYGHRSYEYPTEAAYRPEASPPPVGYPSSHGRPTYSPVDDVAPYYPPSRPATGHPLLSLSSARPVGTYQYK